MANLVSKMAQLIQFFLGELPEEVGFVAVTTKKPLKSASGIEKRCGETSILPVCAGGLKKYLYTAMPVGKSYTHLVNTQRAAEKKSLDFQGKGTYCKPVDESLVIYEGTTKNTIGKYYFRMYPDAKLGTKETAVYFAVDANGQEVQITETQYYEYHQKYCAGWSDPKAKRAKTAETQGVEVEDIIQPLNYGLDSIMFVEANDKPIINDLDDDIIKLLKNS